jgi:hypothetical protein
MNNRVKLTFLMLVLTQGLHSVEEYFGRLWEVLPPARFLSSLVSDDLREGFLIINIGLFIFGLLNLKKINRYHKSDEHFQPLFQCGYLL